MRLSTFIRSTFICYLALSSSIFVTTAVLAATPNENVSHPGPTIHATIERGDTSLPIFLVDHLHKGDKLIVSTDKNKKSDVKWLLVLATVSPNGNKVVSKKFDLAEQEDIASIDITADDQIPIVALAPQVRTLFGLHTSFSESANLIIDAIQADPQRFVDLQKIDQISHAIAFLTATLDAAIQSQKPEQAIATAKDLAAKFGVKNVDQACFKDNSVNTKCVANSIVTSEELTVPSEDIWSAAGPNASAAKIPTDIFSSLKIVTEASTYLVNKYGDNYDFASSLGQRIGNTDSIQLLTNARFKSGDIKTAYVYVPSWLNGKQPEFSIADKIPACITKGEIVANIKGALPLTNYWHDWNLELRAPDSPVVLAQFTDLEFKPVAAFSALTSRKMIIIFRLTDAFWMPP